MARFIKIKVVDGVLRETSGIVEYFSRKLVVYKAK